MAMIDDLRIYVESYDKVIWIEDEDAIVRNQIVEVLDNTNGLADCKKIMLLYPGKKDYTNNSVYTYRNLDLQELEELQKIYYLYDFSNKFIVFPKTERCGSLLNYVKTGVLSIEDVRKIM